jgi:hypothetical protein
VFRNAARDDVLVQVIIPPSHGDLQDAVKLLERYLAGELDAPPDGWLDIPERYMHSIDIHCFPSVSIFCFERESNCR